jgi:hypothetical protein
VTILIPQQKTAQRILAEEGQRRTDPRLPPFADIVELARDYLRGAGPDVSGPRESLTAGPEALYVTQAAARQYAEARRINDPEQARIQLTALLIDARQHATDLSTWRMRSKSTGLDIAAKVAIEGRLLMVTHVSVRPYNTGGGG